MSPKKSKASRKVLGKKKMKKTRGGGDPLTAARFGLSNDGKPLESFSELQKLAGQAGGVDYVESDGSDSLLKPPSSPRS